jgi:hypothetical protein
VDHFLEFQVIDIPRGPSNLFAAFLARNRLPYLAVYHGHPSALRARHRAIRLKRGAHLVDFE